MGPQQVKCVQTWTYTDGMKSVDLDEKLALFDDHWSPKIIAEVNDQEVKLAKFEGAFDWHQHGEADELFLVMEGSFAMEFRDRSVRLEKGQMIVVPRGVEHKPVADDGGCSVMLIEPKGLVNTGDGEDNELSTTGTWI